MNQYLSLTVLTASGVYLLWIGLVDRLPAEYHYAVALYLCWALSWCPSMPFHAFASIRKSEVGPRKHPFDFRMRHMRYRTIALHVIVKLSLWGLAHHPYLQFYLLCFATLIRETMRLLEYIPSHGFDDTIPLTVRLEWALTNSLGVIAPFVIGGFCLEVARDTWTVGLVCVVKAAVHVLLSRLLTKPYTGTLTDHKAVNIYAVASMTVPLYVAIWAYVPEDQTPSCLFLAALVDMGAFMSHEKMDIWPHDLYLKASALPFAYVAVPGAPLWTADRVALRYMWALIFTMFIVFLSPWIYRYRDLRSRKRHLERLRSSELRVDQDPPMKTKELVASCQKSAWVLNILSAYFGVLAWDAYDRRVR